jgi:tellurite resistance protein
MAKPGHFHIKFGLAWIAIGLVAAGLIFGLVAGGFYLFALGFVLVGIIQLGIGVFQLLKYRLQGPEARALYHAKIEQRALVRAMVAVAAADNRLDQEEIASIAEIYHSLVGLDLERDLIIQVTKTMADGKYSIYEDLALTQDMISDTMKENIIRACYMVMISDGEIAEQEKTRITEIADTLEIGHDRAVEIVEDVRARQAAINRKD